MISDENMIWYIPSFYGDIKLTRLGPNSTEISWSYMTATEKKALANVLETATKKNWITTDKVPSFFDHDSKGGPYRGNASEDNGSMVFQENLSKIQRLLTIELKPGRKVISAVKFKDGSMEEMTQTVLKPEVVKKAKAGVSVVAPNLGCPEPRMREADLRANRVLETFLDDSQIDDFRRYNQFVSIGAETGNRYLITSRHNQAALAKTGGRQLYDFDSRIPFCIHHDALIPAAEEMLSLHVMLQIPRYESYLRRSE